jgi:hypothetical protein
MNWEIPVYADFDPETLLGNWYAANSGYNAIQIHPIKGETQVKQMVKTYTSGPVRLINYFFELEEGLTNSRTMAIYRGYGLNNEENTIYQGEKDTSGNEDETVDYWLYGAETVQHFSGYQYPGLFRGAFEIYEIGNINEEEMLDSGIVELTDLTLSRRSITSLEVYNTTDETIAKIHIQDDAGNPSDGDPGFQEVVFSGIDQDSIISQSRFISPVLTNSGWIVESGVLVRFEQGAVPEGTISCEVFFSGGPPWIGDYSSVFDVNFQLPESVDIPDFSYDQDTGMVAVGSNTHVQNWVLLYQADNLVAKIEILDRDSDNGNGALDIGTTVSTLTTRGLIPDAVSIGLGEDNTIKIESSTIELSTDQQIAGEAATLAPISSALEIEVENPHFKYSTNNLIASLDSTGADTYELTLNYGDSVAPLTPIVFDAKDETSFKFSFVSDLTLRDLAETTISGSGTIDNQSIEMQGTYLDDAGEVKSISMSGFILQDPVVLIQCELSGDDLSSVGQVFIESPKTSAPKVKSTEAYSTTEGTVFNVQFTKDKSPWYPFPHLKEIVIRTGQGSDIYSYHYTQYDNVPYATGIPYCEYGIFKESFADREYSDFRHGIMTIRDIPFPESGTYEVEFNLYFHGEEQTILTTVDYFNAAPVVSITGPADGTAFTAGDTITFEGNGMDAEDGELTETALVWTSNRDGLMGTGTSITSTTLSTGDHLITLTGTDSQSAVGTDTINITIVNTEPVVDITSPSDDSIFNAGDSIDFAGSGTDTEDGALTDASLVWTSSIDGEIGTGETFSSDGLEPGTHLITLTGTDSHSGTGSDAVTIRVNAAPVVSISSPDDDTVHTDSINVITAAPPNSV